MKHIGILGLLFPVLAQGQLAWVGPDCLIWWESNPPAELVQGYNVHIRSTSGPTVVVDTNVGNAVSTTCSAQGLSNGRYEVWVTAYNPAGESGPSNVVPFALATSAPGAPGGVTAPQGLTVESAGN